MEEQMVVLVQPWVGETEARLPPFPFLVSATKLADLSPFFARHRGLPIITAPDGVLPYAFKVRPRPLRYLCPYPTTHSVSL